MSDRRRFRPALLALGAALLVAAWVLAAIELWDVSIPGDLRTPELDPIRYFSAAQLERAGDYESFLRVDTVLAALAQLAALGWFAIRGPRFARESAAGRIGTGMLLGMLALGVAWLAQFPFQLAAVWWERRHGVLRLDYLEWSIEHFLSVGAQFLFISVALLIVMALAGLWRRRWWLAAAPALVGVALAFTALQPYLIPDLEPVRDPAIAADARAIAAIEQVPETPVRVQRIEELTDAPNAEAVGVGPSERVILWDTLLSRFDRSQIRVVLAHEFAHIAKRHIWKQLAWIVLVLLPIGLIVALATKSRGGIYEPGAIPLAVFVAFALLFVAAPLQNAFSRRLEAEADWSALQVTHDPAAATALFQRFTDLALTDPDPPAWSALLADHPSIISRIEMAEAWRLRAAGVP